ncbi:MAG: zinc-binding dehydrogenase [Galbitalea sp.]
MPWDVAGSLYVAGTTARACIDAVRVRPATPWSWRGPRAASASSRHSWRFWRARAVVATASRENHAFLVDLGAIPVEYARGWSTASARSCPTGVDAFIDTHGDGNVEAAIALGVDRDRITPSRIGRPARNTGCGSTGMSAVPPRETLVELARLVAAGELDLPIAATFPLDQVRAAYERLAKRHGLGKIVLEISPAH